MKSLNDLNIVLGYRCNYFCSHCANNSGPKNISSDLTQDEVAHLKKTISEYSPRHMLFSGGETTLYLHQINEFISSHPNPKDLSVTIVTNGWFGQSESMVKDLLSRFAQLNNLDLSYDRFHNSPTSKIHIENIKKYCDLNGIQFKLTMSVSDPKEILLAEGEDYQFQYQKVVNSGRAKTNRVGFKYFTFDSSVLSKTCPARGRISYLPGLGYSTCCSNLIFNSKDKAHKYADKDISSHQRGAFFQNISSMNFASLLELKKINKDSLKPEHSIECNLCEYIFNQ